MKIINVWSIPPAVEISTMNPRFSLLVATVLMCSSCVSDKMLATGDQDRASNLLANELSIRLIDNKKMLFIKLQNASNLEICLPMELTSNKFTYYINIMIRQDGRVLELNPPGFLVRPLEGYTPIRPGQTVDLSYDISGRFSNLSLGSDRKKTVSLKFLLIDCVNGSLIWSEVTKYELD